MDVRGVSDDIFQLTPSEARTATSAGVEAEEIGRSATLETGQGPSFGAASFFVCVVTHFACPSGDVLR